MKLSVKEKRKQVAAQMIMRDPMRYLLKYWHFPVLFAREGVSA